MKQGNFIYMLVGLLLLLLLAPSITKHFPDSSGLSIQLTFMSIMLIGVWSLHGNDRWFSIGITLAITGIFLFTINFYLESNGIHLLSLFVVLLFCILSAIIAMKQILFSGKISTNKLVGSVCIYLLMGVIWALMYLFINLLTVDAFSGLAQHTNQQTIWEFLYFSFVTLSTLGYGDISPLNELARSLVYLEAICGQFYIAILVASLVGAHMSEQASNKN